MNNCPTGCLPNQDWLTQNQIGVNEPWVCAVENDDFNYVYECKMTDTETFRCVPGVALGSVWLDINDPTAYSCGYITTEDPPEEEPPITICDPREQKSNCNIL